MLVIDWLSSSGCTVQMLPANKRQESDGSKRMVLVLVVGLEMNLSRIISNICIPFRELLVCLWKS